MADFHVKSDTVPALSTSAVNTLRPTISALKTALDTHSSTSYSAARLHAMTYNDLIYAARLHNLPVFGLLEPDPN